jgi:hypothetical protein
MEKINNNNRLRDIGLKHVIVERDRQFSRQLSAGGTATGFPKHQFFASAETGPLARPLPPYYMTGWSVTNGAADER